MSFPIRVHPCLAAFTLVVFVAGCGSGGGSSSSSSPAATSAAPAATTEAQREHGALPLAEAAPVPAGLQCSGDDLVWVNLKSKSYHEPADPYFGRTKSGKYMCKADAITAGYHAAGAMHGHHRFSPEPSATASGY
jgi:hypothetical protein